MKKSSIIGAIGAGCVAIFIFGGYVAKNDLSAGDAVKVVASLGQYHPETDEDRQNALIDIYYDAKDQTRQLLLDAPFGDECANIEFADMTWDYVKFTGKYEQYQMNPDIGPVMCEVVNVVVPTRITFTDGAVEEHDYDMQYLYYAPHPEEYRL